MAIIKEVKPHIRGSEFRELMHKQVDQICDAFKDEGMAGFHIIGWGFKGEFCNGWRIHNDSPFGVTILPAVVTEVLRRNTMECAADYVIDERLL